MPDLDFSSMNLSLGVVCAVLAIGAWIVFKIVKKAIMLVLAVLLALGAAGGAGLHYWWPN